MGDDQVWYAWCFDHGKIHTFVGPGGDWCTARWMPLTGGTKDDALADKTARFGEAEFGDQLPQEQWMEIIRSTPTNARVTYPGTGDA